MFLHSELKNGARPARELIELAKNQCGISEKTLRRAKEQLHVTSELGAYQGQWMWSYPFGLPESSAIQGQA